MLKVIKKTILACICSFLLFTNAAFAEERIVITEGEAEIIASESVAEQSAIASALRNAVEQTSGVYLMSETKVKNYQTLSDEIYTKAQGYISDKEVISKVVKNGYIKVKVKATVSMEPLLEILKKLGLLRKWTVAVIMASDKKDSFEESATTSINEIILDNGFRVVDKDVLTSLEKPAILNQLLSGNYLAASGVLKDNGVDVLVIGKTHSEQVAGNNVDAYGINVNLVSSRGTIEAKLVRADTGELLSSKSFEGRGIGAGNTTQAEALRNAASEAGKYFVSQIVKLPAATSTYIQLYVKGLSFSKAKNLTDTLKTIRGVRRVTNKGFRNKEALYEVETDGDVNLLADNISENKDLLKKFNFDITSVSSGKIEATCN